MSVGKKIILLLLLMLAVAVANICVVFNFQKTQKYNVRIANVAGRQRMLSQKILILALSIARGNNHNCRLLEDVVKLYDSSLGALWHGGETMNMKILSAPVDMEELFQENNALWQPFKEKAEIIIKERHNKVFKKAFDYIRLNEDKLSVVSNQITERFEKISWHKVLKLKITLMVMLGLDGLAFSIGYLLIRKLVKPIKELARAAVEVGRGDLTREIKVSSKDEIGELGAAFHKMIADLESSSNKVISAKDYTDTILRSMIDPLVVVDFEGVIKVVNRATLNLLGYGEEELLGKPVGIIFKMGEEGKISKKTKLQKLTKEGFVRDFKAKSGEKIPVGLYTSIMQDRKGKLLGYVCVARDMRQINRLIIDLEHAQTKLEEWSRTLEKKVEERTKELKQAKDYTEKLLDKLSKANEEIKSFANIVSHDLRSPLVNLKGFSHELKEATREIKEILESVFLHLTDSQRLRVEELLQNDVPEALDFIDSSTSTMERLIGHILTLSRIGRRALNPVEIDTNEFVRNKLKMFKYQIENGNIKVKVKELPTLVADESALDQIFGNILSNAINYLDPERPGEIEIASERLPGGILFIIKDNGRGIAEEDKHKVFELFRRGRQAYAVSGEGMGLPYVKALLERHGGEIWFESQEGIGTTFYFTLGSTSMTEIKHNHSQAV